MTKPVTVSASGASAAVNPGRSASVASRPVYDVAAAGPSFHGGAGNTSAYTRRIPSA
ncbi:hypothetical protein [Streptomyces sp. NBC_00887]|uniref:hypothetical protein n=1 Tax=Streptomyces sp. NBC_00887 TaxID=2975859 RepID=UPI003866A2BF|nr:hypothetical protein OG844_32595 [Streptomyces sp. NBC_00887]